MYAKERNYWKWQILLETQIKQLTMKHHWIIGFKETLAGWLDYCAKHKVDSVRHPTKVNQRLGSENHDISEIQTICRILKKIRTFCLEKFQSMRILYIVENELGSFFMSTADLIGLSRPFLTAYSLGGCIASLISSLTSSLWLLMLPITLRTTLPSCCSACAHSANECFCQYLFFIKTAQCGQFVWQWLFSVLVIYFNNSVSVVCNAPFH